MLDVIIMPKSFNNLETCKSLKKVLTEENVKLISDILKKENFWTLPIVKINLKVSICDGNNRKY